MDMREMTLKDYVNKASTAEPVPGGGSVAALVGALGAALSNMVTGLTENKKAFKALSEETRNEFMKANSEIAELREKVFQITQDDTEVFQKILDAMKLPKETEEEKEKRKEAMQKAYKIALETPLNLAENLLEILKRIPFLAEYGDKFAVSDAGCGALFSYAALEAALFNVLINLAYIKDEEYVEKMDKKRREILENAKELRDKTLTTVYKRIEG